MHIIDFSYLLFFGCFISICVMLWAYWRYVYFFRDPDREAPSGKNIVSPADGIVMYVNVSEDQSTPLAFKNKKKILLKEIVKTDIPSQKWCHIGVFMTFFSVHVNRAPIGGKVRLIHYFHHPGIPNLSMNWVGIRHYLKIKPVLKEPLHILENERNTLCIEGDFPIYIVQIADAYVNKIFCNVKVGDTVNKGERFGRIAMGSQVDIVFPYQENMSFKVKPGDKVAAGESILVDYGNAI